MEVPPDNTGLRRAKPLRDFEEKRNLCTDIHDHRVKVSRKVGFRGSVGCLALMVGFSLSMYYIWIGTTYYPRWPNVEGLWKALFTGYCEKTLANGSYGYARKTHYACDAFFAITWGLNTGFDSPFAWFYSVPFVIMIAHRTMRDVAKCRKGYGEAWTEYERLVPYLFIPYVI